MSVRPTAWPSWSASPWALDISSSAVDYVATWAGRDDAEVLEEALTVIHAAAASILAELEHDEQE